MKQLMGELNTNKIIFSLWLLFLMAISFTSLHTTNIPSTISILIHYFFSFLLFTSLLIFFKSTKYHSRLVVVVVAITLFLVSISGYFYFQPQKADYLPFNNMFYPTFGHNHLAEWLLLVLPLSWWLAIEKKIKLLYLVPILLTLSLWLSYGRIATSLGLLELVAITLLFGARWKRQIPKGLKLIAGLLFAGFVSVLISGAIISTTHPSVCDHFHLQKLFCKTTELTNRTYYWQQALAIWKENPIFGSGLGTFYNASLKHVQTPGFQSAYAHNVVLQLLAETGLVGTIPFVVIFSYLLIKVTRITRNSKTTLAYSLLIAVYASCINALLDFSWSFKSIFYLTLVLIVMLLSFDDPVQRKVDHIYNGKSNFLSLCIFICGMIVGVIAGGYLFLSTVTRFQLEMNPEKMPNQYMKYLKQFKKEYIQLAIETGGVEKIALFSLYGSDQDALRELLLSAQNEFETNQYQNKMFALDPWYALAFFDAESYLKNNTVDQAVRQVDALISFINQKKENFTYVPRYETQIDFANSVLIVADELYKRGKYQKAAEYYVFAQKIDPWILSKHKPVITNSELVIEQVDFIRAIESADVAYFGEYQEIYGTFALDLLWLSIEKDMYLEAEDLLALSVGLLPWDKWQLWDEVLQAVLDEMNGSESEQAILFLDTILESYRDEVITYSEYQLREKVAQQLQKRAVATARDNKIDATTQSIRVMQKLFGDDYWIAVQLGNYYVSTGDLENANQAFDSCLQQFNNDHDDCFGGKQSIIDGNPNKARFDQVSQIILGEKRWQDFR